MLKCPISEKQEKTIADIKNEDPRSHFWDDKRLTALRLTIKRHYVAEQSNLCCYCKTLIEGDHLRAWDAEHILPKSIYPQFSYEPLNLAISCIECNTSKDIYDPLGKPNTKSYPTDTSVYAIVHAHFDSWEEHIERGKYKFSSLSDKGTETIYHCNLFRFWQRAQDRRNSIRDRRFEMEVENLQFATSLEDAEDSLLIILNRLRRLRGQDSID